MLDLIYSGFEPESTALGVNALTIKNKLKDDLADNQIYF